MTDTPTRMSAERIARIEATARAYVDYQYVDAAQATKCARGALALVVELAAVTRERDRLAINEGVGPISPEVYSSLEEHFGHAIKQRDAARAELALLSIPAKGCGDSACAVRKPDGMATNGGCRCFSDRNASRETMMDIRRAFGAARAEVARLEREVETLRVPPVSDMPQRTYRGTLSDVDMATFADAPSADGGAT